MLSKLLKDLAIQNNFFYLKNNIVKMEGWIKLHRKLSKKSYYSKDSEKVHLWIHILFKANHKGKEEYFSGKPIICNPGQFTCGRKQLSQETGISESKIHRILKYFEEIEHQIEQQTSSTNRLISILNWDEYQDIEHQNEQQVNNDRTTSEQQVNNDRTHYKNVKNDKNVKKFIIPTLSQITEYCLERNNKVDYIKFYNFYESKGWMIGKNKMKDWRAAVRTWEKGNNSNPILKPKMVY